MDGAPGTDGGVARDRTRGATSAGRLVAGRSDAALLAHHCLDLAVEPARRRSALVPLGEDGEDHCGDPAMQAAGRRGARGESGATATSADS
jgi:hypothetical protein